MSGNPPTGLRPALPTSQKIVKQLVASHLYAYWIIVAPACPPAGVDIVLALVKKRSTTADLDL